MLARLFYLSGVEMQFFFSVSLATILQTICNIIKIFSQIKILISLYNNPLNQLNLNITISVILAIDLKQNKSIPETLIQDKLGFSYVFSIFFSTSLSLIQVELLFKSLQNSPGQVIHRNGHFTQNKRSVKNVHQA